MEHLELIRRILGGYGETQLEDITPELELTDFGMDSLDRLEFAMAIEKELNVIITDAELDGWRTFNDVNETLKTFNK